MGRAPSEDLREGTVGGMYTVGVKTIDQCFFLLERPRSIIESCKLGIWANCETHLFWSEDCRCEKARG